MYQIYENTSLYLIIYELANTQYVILYIQKYI